MPDEPRLIAWLRARAAGAGGERIGDDAALFPGDGPWAVTVDTQVEGVHFPLGLDPSWVARRLLAVNLSDLAAMGARPRFALLALAVPKGFPHRRFLAALVTACKKHGVELIGGDLSTSSQITTVLTLIGERWPRSRWVRRGNARAGDRLWCGGSLGESAAGRLLLAQGATVSGGMIDLPATFPHGLSSPAKRAIRRHLAPAPQLVLGRWLASRSRAAAIDLSDGLAIDLHRLCTESTVGARIESARLPASPRLDALAAGLGVTVAELQRSGGEDYVLLFSLPPRVSPPAELGCTWIGEITSERRLSWIDHGREEKIEIAGWDHLADS